MTKKQKEIFIIEEGDQWFKRNNSVVPNTKNFKDIDSFVSLIKEKDKILDIGTSSGTKLDYLSRNLSSLDLGLYGIDPSSESIKNGSQQYPNLNLKQGTGLPPSPIPPKLRES